jgi:hypothetical protein
MDTNGAARSRFFPVRRDTPGAVARHADPILRSRRSDEQGFRVESKIFPEFHEVGLDGDYYTQDQIRVLCLVALGIFPGVTSTKQRDPS